LEAREQEMDDLESKMTTGAELLADNDSRLCQLEFSLLDNSTVCVITYCFSVFFTATLLNVLIGLGNGSPMASSCCSVVVGVVVLVVVRYSNP